MKILFNVFNIVGRGTYLRAFELARALTNKGHSLTILASSDRVRTQTTITTVQNITVIEVPNLFNGPIQSGWDILNLFNRMNIVKTLDVDIVHGFESRPTVIYPALILKHKGASLFLDWADWFGNLGSVEERPDPFFRTIYKPFENFYETNFRHKPIGTTVICNTLNKRAITMGVTQNSLCLLPNGFDISGWSPISITKARKKTGLSETKYLIGYLGSLFSRDADLLTQTTNELINSNLDIKILHVGHSNYSLENNLTLPNSVITTGPVDFQKMQTYLSACNILLLPFRDTPANNGRFPLKFSNYLACGRPIVSTNVGDIPNYIHKEQVGLVTEDNPGSIASTILNLLSDPSLMQQCGKAAYFLSNKQSESWSKRGDDLISFYKKRINDEK